MTKKIKTKAQRKSDYLSKFDGSFIYYIRHKETLEIKYIGETSNIAKRYNDHFHEPKRTTSAFNNWCMENNIDKSNYEMVVLDLSDYDTIDADDRRLLEGMLIRYHSLTVINKQRPKELGVFAQERVEHLLSIIDFRFTPFEEIRRNKRIRKERKKNDLAATNN